MCIQNYYTPNHNQSSDTGTTCFESLGKNNLSFIQEECWNDID